VVQARLAHAHGRVEHLADGDDQGEQPGALDPEEGQQRQVGPDGHLGDEPLHAQAAAQAGPERAEEDADREGGHEDGQLQRVGLESGDGHHRRRHDRQAHEDAVEGGKDALGRDVMANVIGQGEGESGRCSFGGGHRSSNIEQQLDSWVRGPERS
jgi:hypothetical protein